MIEEFQIYLDALNKYTPLYWEYYRPYQIYRLKGCRFVSYEVERSEGGYNLVVTRQDLDTGVVDDFLELQNSPFCAIIERVNDMENPKGV
jgi:hypothetical protein